MNKIPPFFVGQEVVCIKDHSRGVVKKGEEFKVLAIRKICCGWFIDVGINVEIIAWTCSVCGFRGFYNEYWLGTRLFAPKDQFQPISFTRILETELTSVN